MLKPDLDLTGVLDEAYVRLHRTGPEFAGYLSNHGPMASESLVQLGLGDHVHAWLDGYIGKLEERPVGVSRITPDQFAEALGDPRRFGDWLDYFQSQVMDRDWRDVLAQWWPTLLPGSLASATHSLIRVGHSVRALSAVETPPRVAELGQALGYWAARYQPVAGTANPAGRLTAAQALDALPRVPGQNGGVSARVSQLAHTSGWTEATAALQPPASADDVPAALAALTDAGVTRYLSHGHGDAILLVHAATAPNAAMLALEALPKDLWLQTHTAIWHVCAALTAGFAPAQVWSGPRAKPADSASEAGQQALDNGDEHIIKFTDTALRAERRGLATGRAAAAHALAIIAADG
jgi:Questin oxidase-like